ncbi:Chromodomain-helicase-DNA-binding protein 1-like [Galemys pyrenaicus]|uniref:Chromodomain-helicase-DNA-binding protein 1-like n=1 Tax=Galemys pyrenaicus TaxID=202257 RepID=A0A8J6AHY3_GALPY|nr:Chromodomain-helicase-DNA-binding protein 1-like [Galemys pyrenaicus]
MERGAAATGGDPRPGFLQALDGPHGAEAVRSRVQEQDLRQWGLTGVSLRAYQLEGVNWLAQRFHGQNGCILGDEMGLGKTCQKQRPASPKGGRLKLGAAREPLTAALDAGQVRRGRCCWFAPGLSCVAYSGDREERARLQRDLKQEPLRFHVLLTTFEVCLKDASFLKSPAAPGVPPCVPVEPSPQLCLRLVPSTRDCRDLLHLAPQRFPREQAPRLWVPAPVTFPWSVLVVDEAHRLKNQSSLLHKTLSESGQKRGSRSTTPPRGSGHKARARAVWALAALCRRGHGDRVSAQGLLAAPPGSVDVLPTAPPARGSRRLLALSRERLSCAQRPARGRAPVVGPRFSVVFNLLLTGTPVQNSLQELYSLLSFVEPDVFSSEQVDGFVQRYQGIEKDPKSGRFLLQTVAGVRARCCEGRVVTVARGATWRRASELHRLLQPYLLRRVKAEVATELPRKTEVVLYHGMSALQKKCYKGILMKDLDAFENEMAKKVKLQNILSQLRKCVGHPYLFDGVEPEPFEVGEHLIEASGKLHLLDKLLAFLYSRGHRVLLFSQMTQMLDILQDYMDYRGYSYERVDGSVRGEERHLAIKNFGQQPVFVFLLSTRAGGVGMNLTAADTVIFVDSDFNPQNDLQAAARAHRIGQSRTVKVIRLVGRDTVEEIVYRRAAAKLQLSTAVVGGGHFTLGAQRPAADADLQLSDILKFGLDKLLSSEGSSVDEVDLESVLGETQAGQWVSPASAPAAGGTAEQEEGESHMYLFEGKDYSKEPSKEDRKSFEQLVNLQKALLEETSQEGRLLRNKGSVRTVRSVLIPGLLGGPTKRKRVLSPEELEDRRKRRQEAAAKRRQRLEEQQRKQEEAAHERKMAWWESSNYRSPCLPSAESEPEDLWDGDDARPASLEHEDPDATAITYLSGDVTHPRAGPGDAIVVHCVGRCCGGPGGAGVGPRLLHEGRAELARCPGSPLVQRPAPSAARDLRADTPPPPVVLPHVSLPGPLQRRRWALPVQAAGMAFVRRRYPVPGPELDTCRHPLQRMSSSQTDAAGAWPVPPQPPTSAEGPVVTSAWTLPSAPWQGRGSTGEPAPQCRCSQCWGTGRRPKSPSHAAPAFLPDRSFPSLWASLCPARSRLDTAPDGRSSSPLPDDSGRWGRGGLFTALETRSSEPRKVYELAGKMEDLRLGGVLLFPVDDRESRSSGQDLLALIVAQHRDHANVLSGIKMAALEEGLRKIFLAAKERKASVHLPRLGHTTRGFNWYGTERLVRKHLAARGVPTYMYPSPA